VLGSGVIWQELRLSTAPNADHGGIWQESSPPGPAASEPLVVGTEP